MSVVTNPDIVERLRFYSEVLENEHGKDCAKAADFIEALWECYQFSDQHYSPETVAEEWFCVGCDVLSTKPHGNGCPVARVEQLTSPGGEKEDGAA